MIGRILVIDVSRVRKPRFYQLLGASEYDQRVLLFCCKTFDVELRLPEFCLAEIDVASHSLNLFGKGLDDVTHVVELSTR